MSTPPSSNSRLISSAASGWRIQGPLVISTITEWHRHLQEQFAAPTPRVLDLSEVTACDAFGVQLLVAAVETAARQGRELALVAVAPCIVEACTAAGVAHPILPAP